MVRSLWTAAQGMRAQQFNLDTIANNLANVNTTGFKKNRADFEDLLYQNQRASGTNATEDTIRPTTIQVGHGARVASTQKLFAQGNLQETKNPSDMAIVGDGFFRIMNYDGSYGYTRDGSFKIDSNREVVTSNGYRMVPPIILPENFIEDSLSVSAQGRVTVKIPNEDTPIEVAQVNLYRFVNPAGLEAIGENLFQETPASGIAIGGTPGLNGMGEIAHRFLEGSNVQLAEEMVRMITAQRAYEFSSKAVQTSDSMLQTAVNLKR